MVGRRGDCPEECRELFLSLCEDSLIGTITPTAAVAGYQFGRLVHHDSLFRFRRGGFHCFLPHDTYMRFFRPSDLLMGKGLNHMYEKIHTASMLQE